MDNDQNFDDTTKEDSEDENVPCDPDKLPYGCYYQSCAYGSSSRQECNKYYICQKSECGCDDCYKRVPIMDIIKWIKEKDN